MGLSKVTVNVGQGGIGRRAPNTDKISGLLFYNDNLPSGFSTSLREIKVLSLEEAEALGIAQGSVNHSVEWYHISEYFRLNPEGELWIGFYDVPAGAYDFAEVTTLQEASAGVIRQMGVFTRRAWDATEPALIQTQVDALASDGMPVSVFYAGDFSGISAVTGWSSIDDLRALDARHVTVVIAQDGGEAGAALFASESTSITALGAVLGATSAANVNQSIGAPIFFNASNGVELETLALANGDLLSALSNTLLGGLKDKGYQVIIKRTPELSGSYFERSPAAVPATNDYAFVELSRTIDKAVRVVNTALIPQLNTGVEVNADGTLSDSTIGYFTDIADAPLQQMLNDGEISAKEVLIDPNQDVIATSTLNVTIRIVPIGTAEFITVNIGLTSSLT